MSIRDVQWASELTGLKVDRIYDLVRQGIFPAIRFGPRQIRFSERAVQDWIDGGGSKTPVTSSNSAAKEMTADAS